MNFYNLINNFRIDPDVFSSFLKNTDFNYLQSRKYEKKWKEQISSQDNFFSFTVFLFFVEDFIILNSLNFDHSLFLFKNYLLDYQAYFVKFFGEKKNVIIVCNYNHNQENNSFSFSNEIFVLFKNVELVKKEINKCIIG